MPADSLEASLMTWAVQKKQKNTEVLQVIQFEPYSIYIFNKIPYQLMAAFQ